MAENARVALEAKDAVAARLRARVAALESELAVVDAARVDAETRLARHEAERALHAADALDDEIARARRDVVEAWGGGATTRDVPSAMKGARESIVTKTAARGRYEENGGRKISFARDDEEGGGGGERTAALERECERLRAELREERRRRVELEARLEPGSDPKTSTGSGAGADEDDDAAFAAKLERMAIEFNL